MPTPFAGLMYDHTDRGDHYWVFASYQQTSVGGNTNKLQLWTSTTGLSWTQQTVSAPGGIIRDPTIRYDATAGKWRVAATSTDLASTSFTLLESTDLVTWTTTAQITPNVVGATQVWAPEWFVDSDASVHLLVSISTDATLGVLNSFGVYEMHPTNAGHTTWSDPVQVLAPGSAPHTIDVFIIKIASTYHLILADGWHFTSSSPFSGYSAATTINPLGHYYEGPCVLALPAAYRMYLDDIGGTHQMGYIETTDATLNSGWSAPTYLTFTPTPDGHVDHGTFIKVY